MFALLIHALILNAAESGRGKRYKKNEMQSEGQRVIVKLYSEEGYLVIENECVDFIDIESIRQRLNRVSESEEDGISLWSFNCYIRRCINSLIMAKMKEIESKMAENAINKEQVCYLGEWIRKLTGEECEICPEQYEKDGIQYFRVKLPIFMEKYCWSMSKERKTE